MSKLIEKRKELEAKQKKLADVFKEAGPEHDMDKVKSLGELDSSAKLDAIRKMNDELTALGKEVDGLAVMEKAAIESERWQKEHDKPEDQPPQPAGPEQVKSVGQMFIESAAYKNRSPHGGPSSVIDVDLKTAMTTAAGLAPQSIRTGKIVEYAQRPIQIADLVPNGVTTQAAIVYMEETTSTSNAAEATENTGVYGEAAFAFTERTATVRKIAVNLPVTQEQLEDVEGIQDFINNRLSFFLRQRFDYQIINGNGTPPNLTGILNCTTPQSFALGGDKFDAIYEAARRVRVTGRAFPNALVIHSNDWQDLRLMRTSEGLYILGNPTQAGPDRIWGLLVVENEVTPEGTSLVGDFANFVQYFEKRGIEIDITDSHASEFTYGILRIRASFRVALPIYRPTAFCYVTGM